MTERAFLPSGVEVNVGRSGDKYGRYPITPEEMEMEMSPVNDDDGNEGGARIVQSDRKGASSRRGDLHHHHHRHCNGNR